MWPIGSPAGVTATRDSAGEPGGAGPELVDQHGLKDDLF
jgi:hypothetical protein